jgi:hypothetical protein
MYIGFTDLRVVYGNKSFHFVSVKFTSYSLKVWDNIQQANGDDYDDNNNNNNNSNNVKITNIFHVQNNITCSTNCKYRIAATLYTLETFFFQVYNSKYPAKRW